MLKRHSSLLVKCNRFADFLLVLGSGYLAYFLYLPQMHDISLLYHLVIISGALSAAIFFQTMRLYNPLRHGNALQVFQRLFWSWIGVLLFITLAVFFTKTGMHFSRAWLALWVVIGIGATFIYRLILLVALSLLRQRGINQRHVVLIGMESLSKRILDQLSHSVWTGYSINKIFTLDYPTICSHKISCEALVEAKLLEYLEVHQPDEVWLCLPLSAQSEIDRIVELLKFHTMNVRLMPDLFVAGLLNLSVSSIAGIVSINLRESPMSGAATLVKWLEDKILATLIIILISPILAVLAIAVKLSSPGPVFFRQKRISWNGREFDILKFRSMPIDAENKTGAVWAKSGENRATKIGAFIRKTSLDELPQFFNVLKGDMSIVGPRPERPVFVEKFKHEIPGYMQKHMVKAGITGWAQVNGWRGNTDLKKRIEYDLYYIENWSIWFDLKIIFLTIFKGFIHQNAY